MAIDNETARDIFETHSQYVFSTALFLTGSRMLADDVAQEAFLKIFRSFHSYDRTKRLRPWIYKIVVNTARVALKNQSKQKTVPLDLDVADRCSEMVHSLLEEENRVALFRALSRVSQKSKEVIVLRFFNDMKVAEIADTLSIPLGTCKSRLNTAMNQLRKELPVDIADQYRGGKEIEES